MIVLFVFFTIKIVVEGKGGVRLEIREYLVSRNINWKEKSTSTGIELKFPCPQCGKEEDFSMNLDSGMFQCLRKNNCGFTGNFITLQKHFGDTPRRAIDDSYFQKKEKVYKEIKVSSDKPVNELYNYFEKRGISEETVKHFKVGYKADSKSIMYPFIRDGKLVGVKYRKLADKKFWKEEGSQPTLFGRDLVGDSHELYICEGSEDCMSLYEMGFKASVSVPDGTSGLQWIEHEWEWLQRFKTIYLVLDSDKAGQSNIATIANRLGKWRVKNVVLPCKDPNDCLINNIDVKPFVADAYEFDNENIKKADSFTSDVIERVFNKEKLYGSSMPWENLQEIMRGWRQNELTVWSGSNHSGKTSILNEVTINEIANGKKVLVCSLEMPPPQLLHWLSLQHLDKPDMTRQDIELSLSYMGESLFLVDKVGHLDKETLFDILNFACRKYGIDTIILDSLKRISLDTNNIFEEQGKFINEIVNLVLEYPIHFHLVSHSRKKASDRETPDKSDVSGSSSITDLAHNVIIVWRPDVVTKQELSKEGKYADNYLIVKKCREFGELGMVGLLYKASSKKFIQEN